MFWSEEPLVREKIFQEPPHNPHANKTHVYYHLFPDAIEIIYFKLFKLNTHLKDLLHGNEHFQFE